MSRLLVIAVLFFANLPPARAEMFAFEGFYLGMTRADASNVHPEAAWHRIAQESSSEVTRKEFASHYLGREAEVSVGLDRDGRFVSLIGFTFHPQSDSQCLVDAVSARFLLEKRYGPAAERVNEPLAKRAQWNTAEGVTVRWVAACFVGTGEYFITYAKPAR